jgi:hypothetical protein
MVDEMADSSVERTVETSGPRFLDKLKLMKEQWLWMHLYSQRQKSSHMTVRQLPKLFHNLSRGICTSYRLPPTDTAQSRR